MPKKPWVCGVAHLVPAYFISIWFFLNFRSRTVETTTYACENNGETETRVEQKVTIQSDGEPIDHDEALAQAIQEATAMNPDMTVEKIEIHQTTQAESDSL